jgi:chromosome partitioning protein
MIVTVASFKGGVAKTTTAVHLAAFANARGSTILIDGDPNRSASGWARRGTLPFPVVDERQASRTIRDSAPEHIVIDTAARPSREDLEALAGGCDLLVIPTTPDALSLDALMATVETLQAIGTTRFKILLTIVPPRPSRDGDDARAMIDEAGLPRFAGSVRRLAVFQKAALAGVTVSEVKDPRAGEAWADYEVVGQELLP